MLEHAITRALAGGSKSLGFTAKQDLFESLFNNALAKLEETFTEKHYEMYFDKIANHFDESWKEDMKTSIFKGVTN